MSGKPLTVFLLTAVILTALYLRRLSLAKVKVVQTGPSHEPFSGTLGATSPLERLREFARMNDLTITSETGGRHNTGSLHYQGRAIDVVTSRMTDDFVAGLREAAARFGILLRDERRHPPGQKVWGGPHLHLEVPRVGGRLP